MQTEHTMIVGSGANKFAAEMGIPFVSTESLLTEHAKEELENYKIYKTVVKVDFKSRYCGICFCKLRNFCMCIIYAVWIYALYF